MRKDFSERLRRTVDKMGWPGKELVLTDDLIEEWVEGVELLLDLQEPYGASSNSALFFET
jgi:RAD50-interacting protein 1